ncbi:MAG: LysE family translocator [Usitatibacteraceae bacterium]
MPGMDMAYVVASSLSGGRRGAVASVLGIASGGIVHVVVGATGIAALMAVFPQLFHILLAIGTLYLIWIGWNILRSADAAPPTAETLHVANRTIYRRAVVTCLLNPKAYAFTLAIFPAFVHSDVRSVVAQTAALCLITAITQIAVYGVVGALAVRSREFMHARHKTISRTMGALLIGAAILTATQAWSATGSENASKPLTSNARKSTMSTMTEIQIKNPLEKSGRDDFDFEIGDWQAENRRLVKPLEEDSPWETFSGTVHMEKLPGGIGNIDTLFAPEWRPNWMGMALRVFNGDTGLWSIFWLNSKTGGIVSNTGHLDVPVVGKFENGTGIFEGDDVINGVSLRVRYTWSDTRTAHPKWQQDFSFDGGKTWKPNWYMTFTRVKRLG